MHVVVLDALLAIGLDLVSGLRLAARVPPNAAGRTQRGGRIKPSPVAAITSWAYGMRGARSCTVAFQVSSWSARSGG